MLRLTLGSWEGILRAIGSVPMVCAPAQQASRLTVSVYAAANNQHNLDAEISDVLTETSFYKAIVLARGTVSVVDSDGKCWTRIWCCSFDASMTRRLGLNVCVA